MPPVSGPPFPARSDTVSVGSGPDPTRLAPADLDEAAAAYARSAATLPAASAERPRLRDRLVRAGLPYAARLARRYAGRGEPLDDLIQVARIGLLKSVDRYDPERGSFTAFASVTMLGELRRHFRDLTWGVHVPRRMRQLSLEVSRLDADLVQGLRRAPTTAEVADHLRAEPADVRAARVTGLARGVVSLNSPVRRDGEDGEELQDRIADPGVALTLIEDRLTVTALLCRMPARERRILALRFYGNRTQAQIAQELGISQVHVSRLLSRALAWLRAAIMSDATPPWPDATGTGRDGHQLSVRERLVGRTLLLDVGGEVDRDVAGRLRDALLDAVRRPVREVVLRVTAVPFIDAAGIGALVVGAEAARGANVRFGVAGAQPQVVRVMRAAGLGSLLRPPTPAGRVGAPHR